MLQHNRFKPVAVCDISPARAKLLATRAGGIASYGDWRELLGHEKLDAVVLALPPEVSPDVVEACLSRGLAVLDEKPLAASVAAGRRLARLIGDRECVYQVGFVLRYGDWVRDIQRLSSSLGSPQRISVDIFDERLDVKNSVHLSRIQSFLRNSSALTHEGSHVIDYVGLWRNANWSNVTASAHKTLDIFDGPNVWSARIEFEDHTTLDLQVGWLLAELPLSTVAVHGPHGRLQFNLATGRGELDLDGRRVPLDWKPITTEWRRQYDAFAEAIDIGQANCATVHDASHDSSRNILWAIPARTSWGRCAPDLLQISSFGPWRSFLAARLSSPELQPEVLPKHRSILRVADRLLRFLLRSSTISVFFPPILTSVRVQQGALRLNRCHTSCCDDGIESSSRLLVQIMQSFQPQRRG